MLLVLIVSFFVLESCSESTKVYAPVAYKDVKIELNDGKRWPVSEGMKPYIKTSFEIINSNPDSFEKRAPELSELKNEFINSCDMSGVGHDNLHTWLMPYIDLLNELETADSERMSELQLELKNAQKVYRAHFE